MVGSERVSFAAWRQRPSWFRESVMMGFSRNRKRKGRCRIGSMTVQRERKAEELVCVEILVKEGRNWEMCLK